MYLDRARERKYKSDYHDNDAWSDWKCTAGSYTNMRSIQKFLETTESIQVTAIFKPAD